MNKLIGLYIFLIILIALFALFNVNFYPDFLIRAPFTPFIHKLFEGLVTFIFILIFLKANQLYSETQDRRMAIIAGSFLAGSCFNFYHLSTDFGHLFNVLTFENIKMNPELIYLLATKLIIPISLFIAIFYIKKFSDKKLKYFRLKTYSLYFCIFLSTIIWDKFIFQLLPGSIINKILLIEHNLSIIDESLYFLIALFLIDRNLTCGKKLFSVFIAGLFFLGLSELFDINPTFWAINEVFSHSLKTFGFLLIFLGIKKFQLLPDIKSIKEKILTSLALFLIISYLTFSFFISLISKINLSLNLPYIFIEFLLISAIIGYIITSDFTSPISNIIQIINNFEPGKKSEKIKISSNDEVGELSKKLNEIIDREWDHSQKLLANQAKIQELLDMEHLLFEVTNIIRSSLDINKTLSIIGDEIAKVFNVERASIVEFPYYKDYKKWIVRKEYKINEDIKGLDNIDFDVRAGEYNGIFVVDQGQNLVINNLMESDTPDFYKKNYGSMGIKSILSVPIRRAKDKWGLIFLSEYEYYREWTEDEVTLLQTIADQIYIAIKQAELFETVKQTANRESLLRKIIEIIRSTLDINETKKTFVTEIGNALNANRVFFIEYDPETNTPLILNEYSEYLSSPDQISCVGFDFSSPEVQSYTNIHKQTNPIIVQDVEEFIKENNLKGTLEEQWVSKIQLKTGLGIPIFYGTKIYGVLAVHYTRKKVYITDEQIEFVKTLGNQMGIALYQVKLYETVKQTAERESLLRQIVETIRRTLDINEAKKIIVNEMGTVFNADRCYFRAFDKKTDKFLPPGIEYLASPDIESLMNVEPDQEGLKYFIDTLTKQEKGSYPIIVDIDSIKDPLVERYMKNAGILVDYAIPMWDRQDELTYLVLHYATQKPGLQKEDLDLMETIAKQVTIAIDQAKLYETIKEQAEREILLRKIVETIRSTLDINEIKTLFVNSIGQFFKANRVLFSEFNPQKNMYEPVDHYSEYLSSPKEISFIGYDWSNPEISEYIQPLIEKQEINIYNLDEYLKQNPKSPAFISLFRNANVQSSYNIPVLYLNENMGYFCVEFTQKEYRIPKEEFEFLKDLINQVGIAIHQAKLYETIKKQAENERILREIISEIKVSQTLEEVYDYIITKLANTFDTERAFFVEIPAFENEKPSIKHQYHKRPDIPFIPDHMIQEKCLINLIETANKKGIAIISNTSEHNQDDERLQNFFKTFNIKSILLVPLIRYNHDIKLLGAFVLCLGRIKEWSEDEINLIKSIAGSTVTVVWEIKKRIELEELRDVFILTLTHDLQVPLVGEHKALEFVTSRPAEQPIGKFKDIITDILKSNEGLTTLLKKLLNTYNFESGKQKLDLSLENLSVPITEVIDSLKDLADSKQISIETQIDENLPSIMMDSGQIKNVLHTLLENSITYIQQGGHIIIKSEIEKDKIITSVIDNGPGIPYRTRERIFERYAMAIAIERKIGAGLGLYLAKQIIEAHRGRIWFETELRKGTTFYFSLPLE